MKRTILIIAICALASLLGATPAPSHWLMSELKGWTNIEFKNIDFLAGSNKSELIYRREVVRNNPETVRMWVCWLDRRDRDDRQQLNRTVRFLEPKCEITRVSNYAFDPSLFWMAGPPWNGQGQIQRCELSTEPRENIRRLVCDHYQYVRAGERGAELSAEFLNLTVGDVSQAFGRTNEQPRISVQLSPRNEAQLRPHRPGDNPVFTSADEEQTEETKAH